MGETKSKPLSNTNHETFCQAYIRDRDCFGNATAAYVVAYGFDPASKKQRKVALTNGPRLLGNAGIKERINCILEEYLNDEVVDRELANVVAQNKDLHAKVAAIREYNSVRGRITKNVKLSGHVAVANLNPNDEIYKEIIEEEADRLRNKKASRQRSSGSK